FALIGPMRSPRVLAALLIFAMSTLAGVYFAWQLAVAYPPPITRPFGEALAINLTYYYLWGLLVPVVVYVARRFLFEKGLPASSIVIHALCSVVLTLAEIVAAEMILTALHARHPGPKGYVDAITNN